eukprot:scaffold41654_cov516-Skeletonema_dohrnii-CCMP3373.AAC.1
MLQCNNLCRFRFNTSRNLPTHHITSLFSAPRPSSIMNSGSGSGRFNTVIFNDGEIVHRQNKKSTLLEGTADEQPQQGNDADVNFKEENKYAFD